MTEKELAVLNILTQPTLDLLDAERTRVRAIARDLLSTLKRQKIVPDCQKRQQYSAGVRLAIEDILYDRLHEPYRAELCDRKRDDLSAHIR